MPRKCSIEICTSNYESKEDHIKIYKFPRNNDLKQKWLSAIPATTKGPTDNMGVCAKHWPPGSKMYYPPRSKYQVPCDPPSIFPGYTPSMLRQTATLSSRSTDISKLSLTTRNSMSDELLLFNKLDMIHDWHSASIFIEVQQRLYFNY